MCSGRVDPEFIFRAFANGMDGVFIGGCILNECNYITHGNYQALNMVLLTKKIMEHIGLNPDRLRIEFMSSGEGGVYVDVVNDFVRQIKEIGPIGEADGLNKHELATKIAEIRKLIPYIKQVKREKMEKRLASPSEYEGYYTAEEIDQMFDEVVSYYIDPEKCKACMMCARRCPVDAIESAKGQIHVIDQDKCIRCNTCYDVCPEKFAAVTKIVSAPVPDPIPVEARALTKGE
jgi:F420-non-reducing hydrogenase iron-sulfur subunit